MCEVFKRCQVSKDPEDFPPYLKDKLIAAKNLSLLWRLMRNLPSPCHFLLLLVGYEAHGYFGEWPGDSATESFFIQEWCPTISWALCWWTKKATWLNPVLLSQPLPLDFEYYLCNTWSLSKDSNLPRHTECGRPTPRGQRPINGYC